MERNRDSNKLWLVLSHRRNANYTKKDERNQETKNTIFLFRLKDEDCPN